MKAYVGLDASMEPTAIRIAAERMVASSPESIATFARAPGSEIERVGLETGSLAVRLWNELRALSLPANALKARSWP